MPAVARLGDPIDCGDIICEGSGDVFAEGIPVTRVLEDYTCGHCFNPTQIASGSSNVFVNDKAIARVGDPIIDHICLSTTHGGSIAAGATNVYANS